MPASRSSTPGSSASPRHPNPRGVEGSARLRARLGLCLLAVSLCASCDRATLDSIAQPPTNPSATAPSNLDPKGFETSWKLLARTLPKDTAVLSVVVSQSAIRVQAKDPQSSELVFQHEIRAGNIRQPREVSLGGQGTLAHNLFPLSEAKLSVVPQLAVEALDRVKVREPEITRVVLKRDLPKSNSLRFRVLVAGLSRQGHLEADGQGNILSVKLD